MAMMAVTVALYLTSQSLFCQGLQVSIPCHVRMEEAAGGRNQMYLRLIFMQSMCLVVHLVILRHARKKKALNWKTDNDAVLNIYKFNLAILPVDEIHCDLHLSGSSHWDLTALSK